MVGVGAPRTAAAPDGGWGWLVVIASFVLQGLTIGITYTFGVLFVDLLEYFKESQSTTAWIGSIQPALLYFTGILSGPLIRRFGWRKVTILGSILSATGFAVSSLAPNIYMLYFTYGVLTGIGNGLMYVTSMVVVQHYFDKRRAMATGLAVSGSGVGTLTFGFLIRKLLDTLGWRWTLVVEGGIMMIGVLCGVMFRPLPNNMDTSDSVNSCTEKINSQPQRPENGLYELNPREGCCSCFSSCMHEVFDLTIFKNPVYWLFCFTVLMFCFGYHVPYTYSPERARSLGVDPQRSSLLVSFMGLSNVGSRLIFGWVADRSPRVRFWMAGIMVTMGGVVSIFIFLFTTYTLMVVYSVLFGAFTGSFAALFPIILVDLMGIEAIERTLGQCLAAGSIAFLVASPISGVLIQETGNNYDVPFLVMGGMEALGGLVFLFIKCCQRSWDEYEPLAGEEEETSRRRKRFISESFS